MFAYVGRNQNLKDLKHFDAKNLDDMIKGLKKQLAVIQASG